MDTTTIRLFDCGVVIYYELWVEYPVSLLRLSGKRGYLVFLNEGWG